jgi:hypothetical protein
MGTRIGYYDEREGVTKEERCRDRWRTGTSQFCEDMNEDRRRQNNVGFPLSADERECARFRADGGEYGLYKSASAFYWTFYSSHAMRKHRIREVLRNSLEKVLPR